MHDPEEGGPFIAGKITVLERQSLRKRKWEWQSVKYSGFLVTYILLKELEIIHGQAGGRIGGENFPQGKFSRNF